MYISFFDNLAKGLVLFCGIVSSTSLYAQSKPIDDEHLVVEFENNRLSLNAVDATYESIFKRISKKAGLTATINGDLSERTTITYTDVNIEYVLQRLLPKGYALIMVMKKDEAKLVQPRIVAFDIYGPEAGNKHVTLSPPRVVEVVSDIEPVEKVTAEDRQQIERLTGLVDTETINQLAGILQSSSDPTARVRAIQALAKIPHEQALDVIEQGLADADESVRITTLETLAEKDIHNIDLILGQVIFGDRSLALRQRAVEILGSRGTEVAGAFLMSAMDDPDELVRTNATRLHMQREIKQAE